MTADRPAIEPRKACPDCDHDVDHTTPCPEGCPLCPASARDRLDEILRDGETVPTMAGWMRLTAAINDALAEAAEGGVPRADKGGAA